MTLRWGLVGYGLFGRHHARLLAQTEGAALHSICTRSAESAEAAAADHPQARVMRDWRELLQDPQVDAVDVVVPNHLHAEIACAALDAGKAVLLEKPMATTRADCDRIVAAAARSGRPLSVGFELRLSSQWGEIKRLIDAGAVGVPRYLNLSLFRFPYRGGAQGWRYDRAAVGSWILEEPVHFYDLVMWYLADLGPPLAVGARGTTAGEGMYDNFTSALTFQGGAYATITQSLAGFEHHVVLELAGSAGALRSTWSAGDTRSEEPRFDLTLKREGDDAPQAVVPQRPSGELFELAEELRLTTAAFARGHTLVGPDEARRAVIVCLEAERALQAGGEVALSFEME